MVAVLRQRAGIELLSGLDRLVGGQRVVTYRPGRPTASATHLKGAHLIHLEEGAEITWETGSVPEDLGRRRVLVVFPMAMGNGSPLPQAGGNFSLFVDEHCVVRFTLTKDSCTWRGPGTQFRFDVRRVDGVAFGERLGLDEVLRDESVFCDGLGFLLVEPELVSEGRPIRLRIAAEPGEPSTGWFRLGESLFPLLSDHLQPGLSEVLEPPARPRVGDHTLLMGDLHSHSAESLRLGGDGCGRGNRDEMFRFAWEVAGLDVFSLSEHDWQLESADWEELGELNEKYNQPGEFVTVPSFEWTSANHGHRNVYFRHSGAGLFDSSLAGSPRNTIEDGAPTPRDLWDYLARQGVPAITVPHHMSAAWFPLSLDRYHHPDYDRVAEIYSTWGDSLQHGQPVTMYADRVPELAFINAIRAGYRVGFIGSSDTHDGRPGAAQGTASHPHLFHHLGSGRAAILATEFDRRSVFDALQARRCYALTGPRIEIDFSTEGHPMGSEVPMSIFGRRPGFDVDISTGVPIDRIEVFRDGERCDLLSSGRRREQFRWVDPKPMEGSVTSYFLKVSRTDHEMAWTSPIWVRR
jgi:hypothetical protein